MGGIAIMSSDRSSSTHKPGFLVSEVPRRNEFLGKMNLFIG